MALKPQNLVLDFDGTITNQDTIGVLADIGHRFQHHRHTNISPTWSQIVAEYGQDHDAYYSAYQPVSDQRLSLEDELDFLRSLRGVEERSLRRVESSGLFRGIDHDTLEEGGRQALRSGAVQLRDGFAELMAVASRRAWHVSVVSVNWSTSFLRGVLDGYPIHDFIANEIRNDGRIIGPEILGAQREDTVMMTCEDKHRALHALLHHEGAYPESMVYFGDSTTDIECLTHGRGVVISSDVASKLITTLRRVGFQLPAAVEAGPSTDLVWARSFKELLETQFCG